MKPNSGASLRPTRVRALAFAEERAGRVRQAIAILKQAVDAGPDDWTNVRILADMLTRAGERKAANEHYRRLAQNCEIDQLYTQAIAVWKRILANEPELTGAHLKLGELYALTGLRADARKHYKAALAQYQTAGHPREVAQVEARLAHLDETPGAAPAAAVPPLSLEQAVGRDEASVEAGFVTESLTQARLFRRYGLHVQSRARLDAILARLPDHLEARRELWDLLREVGPPEEAREQERLLEELEAASREEAPTAPEASAPLEAPLAELAPAIAAEEAPSAEPAPAPEASPPEVTAGAEAADRPRPEPTPGPTPVVPERGNRDELGFQLGRDDYEVRYNLGVAYREMGLLDEAIAELQLAAGDPSRLVECASMLAACFVEQEQPARAVKWLEKGLTVPGLAPPHRRGLLYHLAVACEASGEAARALGIFRELQKEDAGFRDVQEKVRRLSEDEGRGSSSEGGE